MEFAELIDRLWFVTPLIWITCALLWMIRGRFCLGSIIGGVGFLLLFVGSMLFGLLRAFDQYGDIDLSEVYEVVMELMPYTSLLFLAGEVLILLGLATTRYRASSSQSTQYAPSGPRYADPEPQVQRLQESPRYEPSSHSEYNDGPYQASDVGPAAPMHRPGWGLAGSWIALSGLAWLLGGIGLVMVLDSGNHINDTEMMQIGVTFGLWFLCALPAGIIFCVWLHRAWSAVPPIDRSTSPGKAVGYLFIPFFNIYWIFRAIPGLSASTRRAQDALDSRSSGGAAYGIGVVATVVAVIPYVNILSWFFFLVWIIMANSATNRLLQTRARVEG